MEVYESTRSILSLTEITKKGAVPHKRKQNIADWTIKRQHNQSRIVKASITLWLNVKEKKKNSLSFGGALPNRPNGENATGSYPKMKILS